LTSPAWVEHAFVYHLFPLGVCGAPWTNHDPETVPRLYKLNDWIEPAQRIGANTVLWGPIWESESHGYDTRIYGQLDHRLGTNDDLKAVVRQWKDQGFRVLFDGVFNHCGRGFAPFEDLRSNGNQSPYRDWFAGVDFSQSNSLGDPFSYEGWNGHLALVKFNLKNPEVRRFLFEQVSAWMDEYGLDGLRLDAADVMDLDFLRALSEHCLSKNQEFWLLGEVIHGDYRDWAPGAGLHAVTNYELFKGLWSSHNDSNYFEAAWTLNRQFGPEGLYRGQLFSTFGDNHDVDRAASTLTNPAHLYPHAILCAAVPGVPTVYYGSEAGLEGKKTSTGDEPLRPALSPDALTALPHTALRGLWAQLAELRRQFSALRTGGYRQALAASKQFAFFRETQQEVLLIAVNSASESVTVRISLPESCYLGRWDDVLNPGASFETQRNEVELVLHPFWGRILKFANESQPH